jgi:hypothetical protein
MLPIRFEGTFFTQKQTERLQAIAGLSSIDVAVVHAGGISSVLVLVKPFLKPKSPRAEQDALRRIEKISRLARELANLLDREPSSTSLVQPDTITWDDRYVSDVVKEIESARDDLVKTLRRVENRAVKFQEDRRSHRIELGLLPDPLDQRNPEVAMLWPSLFQYWEHWLGRHVAKTEDGPLHSFINLAHEVLELSPAAHRTFRDAVDRWSKEEGDRWQKDHVRWKEDYELHKEEYDSEYKLWLEEEGGSESEA